MMKKTIFVVASGSGGHILPALELARQWHDKNQDGSVVLITGSSDLEKKIIETTSASPFDKLRMSARGEPVEPCAHRYSFITQTYTIFIPKFSLNNWYAMPVIVFKTILAFFKTRSLLKHYTPEKIISTGGLLSVPVCLAGWSKGIETRVFELNVIPGKAVVFLLPFVKKVFTVFEQTQSQCRFLGKDFSKKCVLTTYPVRFTHDDVTRDRNEVLALVNKRLQENNAPLKCEKNRKTLFIVGGSQGSMLLNNLMTGFIETNPKMYACLQIIHQIGKGDTRKWETWYAQKGIPSCVFSYDENIKDYYLLADLIVSRSGAGTMFEIAFFNKKCITIPLVAGTTDHQVYNARAMASRHQALFTVIEQDVVIKNPELFYKKAIELLY